MAKTQAATGFKSFFDLGILPADPQAFMQLVGEVGYQDAADVTKQLSGAFGVSQKGLKSALASVSKLSAEELQNPKTIKNALVRKLATGLLEDPASLAGYVYLSGESAAKKAREVIGMEMPGAGSNLTQSKGGAKAAATAADNLEGSLEAATTSQLAGGRPVAAGSITTSSAQDPAQIAMAAEEAATVKRVPVEQVLPPELLAKAQAAGVTEIDPAKAQEMMKALGDQAKKTAQVVGTPSQELVAGQASKNLRALPVKSQMVLEQLTGQPLGSKAPSTILNAVSKAAGGLKPEVQAEATSLVDNIAMQLQEGKDPTAALTRLQQVFREGATAEGPNAVSTLKGLKADTGGKLSALIGVDAKSASPDTVVRKVIEKAQKLPPAQKAKVTRQAETLGRMLESGKNPEPVINAIAKTLETPAQQLPRKTGGMSVADVSKPRKGYRAAQLNKSPEGLAAKASGGGTVAMSPQARARVADAFRQMEENEQRGTYHANLRKELDARKAQAEAARMAQRQVRSSAVKDRLSGLATSADPLKAGGEMSPAEMEKLLGRIRKFKDEGTLRKLIQKTGGDVKDISTIQAALSKAEGTLAGHLKASSVSGEGLIASMERGLLKRGAGKGIGEMALGGLKHAGIGLLLLGLMEGYGKLQEHKDVVRQDLVNSARGPVTAATMLEDLRNQRAAERRATGVAGGVDPRILAAVAQMSQPPLTSSERYIGPNMLEMRLRQNPDELSGILQMLAQGQ